MKGILENSSIKKELVSEIVGIESLAFKRKVQVSGLPENTNVFDLSRFFNQFAPVKHCQLIYKKETGEFQNFGFVEFKTEKEAELVRNIRYFGFKGYQIEVKEALPARAVENKNVTIAIHQDGTNLRRKKVFVDGIPRGTHINEIIKYFNIYAPVEKVDFDEDPQTGEIRRGHGYIIFETEAAANYILKIRFFKYKETLIAAKSALLGKVTQNEDSKQDAGFQIEETPDNQKSKETRTVGTSPVSFMEPKINSLNAPIPTEPPGLAFSALPCPSVYQPPTIFNTQPVFYPPVLQPPIMTVPTTVPHQLNMEYLSQLFYFSFQLQQSQASQDFHETVSSYMQLMDPATSGLYPASRLIPVNQPAANRQINTKNTRSKEVAQTFDLSTESQPLEFRTDEKTNLGNV